MPARMHGNLLIDGRNLFDPEAVREAGLTYESIGRSEARPRAKALTPGG